MPYRETIFAAKNYYHIFCRGNEKRDIFIDSADYERFILRMKEYKAVHRISIICYCLMPNHFHLLLRQNDKKTVASFIHRLTVSYSMYFNKRYSRVGHLFQGNFKAKLIKGDEYLLHLSRYIHLNPLKVIASPSQIQGYAWSSYSEYLNKPKENICDKEIILGQFNQAHYLEAYKNFVGSIL
jgi:REP element-mobilizing transposase RayT